MTSDNRSQGILERLYRSPMAQVMSAIARLIAMLHKPFMVYGFSDPATGVFRKYTRLSSTTAIMNRKALAIGDDVWVWHYSILDATEGLTIEDGAQIGAWVGIFTHGSEHSIRLLGSRFVHVPNSERRGYSRGKVAIGAYTFVGAGSIILPGVTIGKGCLIGAGSLVSKSVPDYSIVVGSPAQVRGSTLDMDARFFKSEDYSDTYFDQTALAQIRERFAKATNAPGTAQTTPSSAP